MTVSPDFSSSTLADLQAAQREIERLRSALREISAYGCGYSEQGCAGLDDREDWCSGCIAAEALAAAPVDAP